MILIDTLAMIQARVSKKDPAAIKHLGDKYYFGELGLEKDAKKAFELYAEAAELGSIDALCNLGNAYYHGDGVQEDKNKAAEYYEKAAMHGHVECRQILGCHEAEKGDQDRTVKHFLISAKVGKKDSIDAIKEMFTMGLAAKEQHAEALKGYQDAVEEMNSHSRDEAKINASDIEEIESRSTSSSPRVGTATPEVSDRTLNSYNRELSSNHIGTWVILPCSIALVRSFIQS